MDKTTVRIGPKDGLSKAEIENVIQMREYSRGRFRHYIDSVDELLVLLSGPLQTITLKAKGMVRCIERL